MQKTLIVSNFNNLYRSLKKVGSLAIFYYKNISCVGSEKLENTASMYFLIERSKQKIRFYI